MDILLSFSYYQAVTLLFRDLCFSGRNEFSLFTEEKKNKTKCQPTAETFHCFSEHLKHFIVQTLSCRRSSQFFLFRHPYLVFLNDWHGVILWKAQYGCLLQAGLSKSPVFSGGTSFSCRHYRWITNRTLQNSFYSYCRFTAGCYTYEPSPEKFVTLNGKKRTTVQATEALQRSGPGHSQHKIILLSRKERKKFC